MDVKPAEAPSERQVLLVVDGLVAKEDDSVLQQGPADLGVGLVVGGSRRSTPEISAPIAGVSGSTDIRRYVMKSLPDCGLPARLSLTPENWLTGFRRPACRAP